MADQKLENFKTFPGHLSGSISMSANFEFSIFAIIPEYLSPFYFVTKRVGDKHIIFVSLISPKDVIFEGGRLNRMTKKIYHST